MNLKEAMKQREAMSDRPVHFLLPECTTFFDLFDSWKEYKRDGKNNSFNWITNYCSLHGQEGNKHGVAGYKSITIKPNEMVCKAIEENMLKIDDDAIGFEIISYADRDYSLVLAHYNLIIGSRWLCYIRTDSIPKQFRKG